MDTSTSEGIWFFIIIFHSLYFKCAVDHTETHIWSVYLIVMRCEHLSLFRTRARNKLCLHVFFLCVCVRKTTDIALCCPDDENKFPPLHLFICLTQWFTGWEQTTIVRIRLNWKISRDPCFPACLFYHVSFFFVFYLVTIACSLVSLEIYTPKKNYTRIVCALLLKNKIIPIHKCIFSVHIYCIIEGFGISVTKLIIDKRFCPPQLITK